MNTFTAQELAELYKKAADGGEIEFRYPTRTEWKTTNCGPTPLSSPSDWRIKPTKKVIDLSVLIESEVLCVFFDQSTPSSATGKLKKIRGSAAYVSNNRDSSGMPVSSRACKPLMNHKHAWQGGECPLPEGFRVKVWYRDGSIVTAAYTDKFKLRWSCEAVNSDIIHFEILGLADGYVMPWESEPNTGY
jgi:hypothetical protein